MSELEIRQRLKTARETLKLSVEDLAAQTGIPPHSLLAWEEGERYPRFKSAQKWADALGFEIKLAPKKLTLSVKKG